MACLQQVKLTATGMFGGGRESRSVAAARSCVIKQRLWDPAMQLAVQQEVPSTSLVAMNELEGWL